MGNVGSSADKGTEALPRISSMQLFNQLQDVRACTLILELRSKALYDASHIDSAVHSGDPLQASSYVTNKLSSRCQWDVVLVTHNASDEEEDRALAFLRKSKVLSLEHVATVKLLAGGFLRFQQTYPFLCSDSPCYEESKLYPSQITQDFNVFLSSHALAYDLEVLRVLGVSHVINVTHDHPNAAGAEDELGISYIRVPVIDESTQDIQSHLSRAVGFLDQAVRGGGRVLVHCRHGQSRSASVLLAWFMQTRRWSLEEALAYLQTQRPRVCPNPGFQTQVQQWVERNEATAEDPERGLLSRPSASNDFARGVSEVHTESSSRLLAGETRTFSCDAMHRIERRAQYLTAAFPCAPLAFVMLPGVTYLHLPPSSLLPSRSSACVSQSLNPVHKDHIHCLMLARRYLEDQGFGVLLGALQPTSDTYVSWKIKGQAMDFKNRFAACELAAMDNAHETTMGEEVPENRTGDTTGGQAERWVETWCSQDTDGNAAAQHCQRFLSRKCKRPVAAFNVCGTDFLSKIGGWDYDLPGVVEYIVVPRQGDPLPEVRPGKGWHVAESRTGDHTASSTRIRSLILGGEWKELVAQGLINQAESTYLQTQHEAGQLYLAQIGA